jgi:GT2 family glycosyltransferase
MEIGGFRTNFWPGEDTAFCLELVQKGYRIVYEPSAVIEHHRRANLVQHFRQLTNYALHRGYFAKRFPATSQRLPYFLPSLFLLTLFPLTILGLAGSPFAVTFLTALLAVYFLLIALSLRRESPVLWLPTLFLIFLSHLAYGSYFLYGLVCPRLPEES